MSVEYAPRGLIGVLTPQANTTVEPEFGILLPAGFALVNGRLTSGAGTMEARLVDYYESLEEALTQFANAPLTAVAAACTGSSYLIGARREDEIFGRLAAARGIPVTNAAYAVVQACRVLGARRIGLVSPYPKALGDASVAYWLSRGLEVGAVVAARGDPAAFHPIYSINARSAADALAAMAGKPVDAVVMLGTGMPTLGPILASPRIGSAPVFSCMLALAWHAVQCSLGVTPTRESLLDFIAGTEWRHRYADRCAAA